MDVFVTIRKLIAEFFGATFNFSWPPSTNIIDGSEGFFRSLIYRKGGGEILITHELIFHPFCPYMRDVTEDSQALTAILFSSNMKSSPIVEGYAPLILPPAQGVSLAFRRNIMTPGRTQRTTGPPLGLPRGWREPTTLRR